jgi:UDP-N-acetylmuramoyl-L-alanyl-D-glutamate--2,6-diaminopimelate ligase
MMAAPTMNGARLGQLLRDFASVPAHLDRAIEGITLDSRDVQPGGLFLACRGACHHGLDFVDAAVERDVGAVAFEPGPGVAPELPANIAALGVPELGRRASAIAARYYGHPSAALDVVGVTGTNGKSSVALMLAQALVHLGVDTRVIGTLGAGAPDKLSRSRLTTPDAVSVQRLLAQFRGDGAAAAVMEASSHGLDQARLEAVRFRLAIFTNLTRDHLDYHGSLAAYGEAKARLFTWPGLQGAVINLGDSFGQSLSARLDPNVSAIGYWAEEAAPPPAVPYPTLNARVLQASARGIQIEFSGDFGRASVESPVVGRFNAANLAAVLGGLLNLGVPFAAGVEALAAVRPAPGRMEPFGGDALPLVIVDFAHTPDGLDEALAAAREHTRGKLYVVFGCGGDRDAGKRSLMGAVAAGAADRVVITDDNPRSEDPEVVAAAILAGCPDRHNVRIEHDRRAAIESALAEARAGDVLVIAGKGHEIEQIVADERRPFDDRAIVRELIAAHDGESGS